MTQAPGGGASGPRVRRYRHEDRDACLAVFDSNVPRWFQLHEREDFAAFLSELPGPFLVVEDEEGVVTACGGVAPESPGLWSLCWGMVRQELHGQDLGTRLLEARVAEALAHPEVTRLRLETIPGTVGFFEKMGFETQRVVPDGYGPGQDKVEMEREVRG